MCLYIEKQTKSIFPRLSKIKGFNWLNKFKIDKKLKDYEFKIAEKNILVYKYIYKCNDKEGLSEVQDYYYTINKIQPKINLNIGYDSGDYFLEKGYHSRLKYKSRSSIKDNNNSLFIIPKGSKYITGIENDDYHITGVVSDSIIYKGHFRNELEHDNLLEQLIQEYGDTLEITNKF